MSDGRLDPAYPIEKIDQAGTLRTDVGDLGPLAQSIDQLGLLTPVVVTADGLLVCGKRRLAATRQLGWTTVPAWIPERVSGALRVFAMRDDQALRLPLTPLDQATVYIEYRRLYAEQARLRQEASRFGNRLTDAKRLGRQLPARALAAFQVTGSQSFQRLDQIADLQRVATDDAEHPLTQWDAAQALAAINMGGAVKPAWKQVKLRQASIALENAAVDPREPEPVRQAASQAIAIINQQTGDTDLLKATLAAVGKVDAIRSGIPKPPVPPPDPLAQVRRRIIQVKLRLICEHGWWDRHDAVAFGQHATKEQHCLLHVLVAGSARFAR
ncbi:MAG: ParB N-terminal domain-containing protein [Propionibacteriaceae bacterium]|nr:ParB N-terminal domain-containing protein [Propionibacteriaceae bacterium]